MKERKTITGHMVVKNEDKWVWFAIMSVIDYLDQLIIFDNGSTDDTVRVIKEIINSKQYNNKIIFEERAEIETDDFWKLRQEQIEKTKTDYFMVVDGDEIWWHRSMEEVCQILQFEEPEILVTHFLNCGGDIYSYRDNNREYYNIDDLTGAYSVRVISMRIEGLHCGGEYGIEGYKDLYDRDVQNHGRKTIFMKNPYLHTSAIQRSTVLKSDLDVMLRKTKLLTKGTYDYKFPQDFAYPDVFYQSYPSFVQNPWKRNNNIFREIAQLIHNIKNCLIWRKNKMLNGREY